MAEDAPFQSWEAQADAAFEAAINGQRSSVFEQDFPPLQATIGSSSHSPLSANSKPFHPSTHTSPASNSTSIASSPSSGSENVPIPQPNNQKCKKSSLPLHRQKKMSKATKREANAMSRLSKPSTTNTSHDPDQYQWQIYEKDKKQRENDAAASIAAENLSIDGEEQVNHDVADDKQ